VANNKRIAPKRTDALTTGSGFPSRRAATFFESLTQQIPAIADLTGTPTNTELKDAVNEILAGMRTIGILEQ
jgi:hypothetical protein